MSDSEYGDNTELEKTHRERKRLPRDFRQIILEPLLTKISTNGLIKKAW